MVHEQPPAMANVLHASRRVSNRPQTAQGPPPERSGPVCSSPNGRTTEAASKTLAGAQDTEGGMLAVLRPCPSRRPRRLPSPGGHFVSVRITRRIAPYPLTSGFDCPAPGAGPSGQRLDRGWRGVLRNVRGLLGPDAERVSSPVNGSGDASGLPRGEVGHGRGEIGHQNIETNMPPAGETRRGRTDLAGDHSRGRGQEEGDQRLPRWPESLLGYDGD